jgi:hypothetical protein
MKKTIQKAMSCLKITKAAYLLLGVAQVNLYNSPLPYLFDRGGGLHPALRYSLCVKFHIQLLHKWNKPSFITKSVECSGGIKKDSQIGEWCERKQIEKKRKRRKSGIQLSLNQTAGKQMI